MVKNKKSNLNIISFSIIFGLMIVTIIGFAFFEEFSKVEAKPSSPNYLGLAELGLIPTVNVCSYNLSAYRITDVGMFDSEGNKYVLLESKFGDEYCPYLLNKKIYIV